MAVCPDGMKQLGDFSDNPSISPLGGSSSRCSTTATLASSLLYGDGSSLVAFDAATGNRLLHTGIGSADNAPESYLLDGLQYILATGENQLDAFVLNQQEPAPAKKAAPAGQ